MLRDVWAVDRPAVAERPAQPEAKAWPETPVREPLPEQPLPDSGSMLSALTRATETDDRSPVRRVASFVALMTITLATAALIGAGIYRAVAGLN